MVAKVTLTTKTRVGLGGTFYGILAVTLVAVAINYARFRNALLVNADIAAFLCFVLKFKKAFISMFVGHPPIKKLFKIHYFYKATICVRSTIW
ncbi:hypothetical protein [Leuconostoc falkenbergense]|uniref:hypothetical protein n=1 Tax=Leuconostoc falkenbergense TaxID=2766470 RepID=UPI0021A9940E|nr:hypothetical protein [Leuconostoc falkenbergense]MCT4390697.1 hypothetical protein [Leuconostoc falkenbergense]MDV8951988.1 hypothetical protein [Leuconostoc falkenbergense]